MNYRQMSGRAGRRGFDLIGHVAFFGIPEGKIKRLITSKLADMRGNLPLTIALYVPFHFFLRKLQHAVLFFECTLSCIRSAL
jgi:hypothetical protein